MTAPAPDPRIDVVAVLRSGAPGFAADSLLALGRRSPNLAAVRAFADCVQDLVADLNARLDRGDPAPLDDALDDLTDRVVADAAARLED